MRNVQNDVIASNREDSKTATTGGVSRGSRVQVRQGINKQGAETYRAVDVVHVGPQRRQSQASNYERLAADLGQFNKALQYAGNAWADYAKRAEKEAEKLKKEKEAAAKRAAAMKRAKGRRSGGGRRKKGKGGSGDVDASKSVDASITKTEDGQQVVNAKESEEAIDRHSKGVDVEVVDVKNDVTTDPGNAKETLGLENTTKKIYKNFTHANKTLKPAIDAENKAQMEEWEKAEFKTMGVDEDGAETGMRSLTVDEINNHYARREQAILAGHKNDPMAVKALMNRNSYHRQDAVARLLKWEAADRKKITSDFNQGNVEKFIEDAKAEGLEGDALLQKVHQRLMADGQVLDSAYSAEDGARDILGAALDAAKNRPTMEGARAIVNILGSSTDRASGITALYEHPKFKDAARKVVKELDKGIAEHEAKSKASAVSKLHLAAAMAGRTPTPLGHIQGRSGDATHDISVQDQLKSMSAELEKTSLYTEDSIPITDPDKQRDALIANFGKVPHLRSKLLAAKLSLRLTAGTPLDPENDPTIKESIDTARAMINSGPGGMAMLARYVPKEMLPYYQMLDAAERSGIMTADNFNEVFSRMVLKKKDGFEIEVPKELKPAFKDLVIEGLNEVQTAQVAMAVKLSVEPDDTLEDVQAKILKVSEAWKANHPTRFGQPFKLPQGLKMNPEQFVRELDHVIDQNISTLFPEFKGKQLVPRLHGDEYYLYEKGSGRPLLHPDTMRPVRMPVAKIEAEATGRMDRLEAAREQAQREISEGRENRSTKRREAESGYDKLKSSAARKITADQQAQIGPEYGGPEWLPDRVRGVTHSFRKWMTGPLLGGTFLAKKDVEAVLNSPDGQAWIDLERTKPEADMLRRKMKDHEDRVAGRKLNKSGVPDFQEEARKDIKRYRQEQKNLERAEQALIDEKSERKNK